MKNVKNEEYQGRHAKKPVKKVRSTKKFIALLLTLGVLGYSGKVTYDVLKANNRGTEIVNEFNENNQELVSKYKNYVKAVAETIRGSKQGILNPVDAYNMYLILQSNGYLSINQEYSYLEPTMFEAPGNLGMSIPLGSGSAGNVISNLNEVMKALGFDSSVQIGYVFRGLEKQCTSSLVAVNYAGVTYLLDPYNHQVYLKDGLVKYKSVTNPDLYFIPSEKMDKQYGPELTADTIAPVMKWDTQDYTKYAESVKQYINPKGAYYPKVTRTYIDTQYSEAILPAIDSYVDILLRDYYVDNNNIRGYLNGDIEWPGKYLERTDEGIISTSFIDEQEAARIIK